MNDLEKRIKITEIVENYFQVNIFAKTRRREVVWSRQLAMYFIWKRTRLSLSTIGLFFEKDHSTVLYSKKKIEDLITVDSKCRADFEAIKELLNNGG